ncbi:aldo/keto reductase [Enterococcus dispar]|uniref:aldo/keto reductase n=1 Tax=Enterococcus dispar TaxID=44009 RepID=UPI00189CF68D|nr:aldo/keto reductase [Enterococcus dispar]WCG34199.1 aldo/keto reductase [Enterococcus dispar]
MEIAGEKIYPIGLGTWHMGDSSAEKTAELAALSTGLVQTTPDAKVALDTAEMYGEGNSERLVGEALKTIQRDTIYLISKVYPWHASKNQLPQSLDASLKRLNTDYLDLYLLHWRGDIPLEETVAAMESAKQAGKIRNWGVSNFDVADLKALAQVPNGKNCVANEVLYNLGNRGIEFDLLPYMKEINLPLIAYSPVAQGDTLGNQFLADELLQNLAKKYQCTIFQLLLAFAIRNNDTLAIPQSSNKQHVLANFAAANILLTADEWELIASHYPAPTKKQPLAVL